MIDIDTLTGSVRTVCSFNAWHAMVNRTGDLMVSDTTYPDTGIQIFDPSDGVGNPRLLCLSLSSNVGAHWDKEHCPYDDGVLKPYTPQHTHPHPSFSSDGTKVVFTSDRTGFSQIYVADVPDTSAAGIEIG